ncbi:MAG: ribonuclease J [Minisyncoccia bacterium]
MIRKKTTSSFSSVSIEDKKQEHTNVEQKIINPVASRIEHKTERPPMHGAPNKKFQPKNSTFQFSKFGKKRPARQSPPPGGRLPTKRNLGEKVSPMATGNIRIVPLGGVEEIGRNMTAIEVGNDIIIIDAGLQMKTADTPGIDYIIPNTNYLEERKDRIRGVIITHGHLDHTGGIPYVMERIGNPPIYSRYLTTIMVQKRQEEFPQAPKLKIEVIEKENRIKLGDTYIRFFGVTHTIPDSMGVIIETPYGVIVNPGDFKLEHTDMIPSEKEKSEYGIFAKENVLLLMADSTNVENPGFSTPEHLAQKGLEEIIKRSTGRLFIGTFASQMERMMKIIEIAEGLGKKVVIEGRSMKNNIEILKIVNLLKAKKETFITLEEMVNYPDSKIVALLTGAQGDEFGALMRISNQSHRQLKLHKGDTIVLSSSIIPGNEKAVEKLKDNLARQGAKIITYRTSDVYVHSTGHGNEGELRWMHQQVKPKFFMPIHGNHYRLQLHKDLAMSLGMSDENIIVPDNGSIIEIQDGGKKIVMLKEKAPSSPMMVDGFAVGDVQDVVIRDRVMLAQDGMFVIIALVDQNTGKLKKSPDLISRGFVYLKENQELLRQVRIIIKKTVEDATVNMKPVDFDFIKNSVGETVSKFLYQKTAKRPLVIPVVLSV